MVAGLGPSYDNHRTIDCPIGEPKTKLGYSEIVTQLCIAVGAVKSEPERARNAAIHGRGGVPLFIGNIIQTYGHYRHIAKHLRTILNFRICTTFYFRLGRESNSPATTNTIYSTLK